MYTEEEQQFMDERLKAISEKCSVPLAELEEAIFCDSFEQFNLNIDALGLKYGLEVESYLQAIMIDFICESALEEG